MSESSSSSGLVPNGLIALPSRSAYVASANATNLKTSTPSTTLMTVRTTRASRSSTTSSRLENISVTYRMLPAGMPPATGST